ncbi:DNA cytosine methyltransferase [Thiofaba sp. EF100]|uniref:DNA cytosine methyltransferase n=1 Tax=Thiofaba sp. EF100 TaxID=3121274 RepID=UPI003222143D
MQSLHLFAGGGGGMLADLILGHEPIAAVEWDAYCCELLRARVESGWFPGLSVHECDVRMFDPSEYAGRVDCIHAGFPCQDISSAGKRAGVGYGTRSGLYREVIRIGDALRPEYIFLENVAAILSKGIEVVVGDLAAMGYDAKWCTLRASDVGAPHQRDRWWCLARRADANRDDRRAGGVEKDAKTDWWNILAWVCQVDNANGQRLSPQDTCLSARPEQSRGRYCKATSFRDWWDVEPAVGRVVDGLAPGLYRRSLAALGNGQVPIQAAVAWCLLGGPVEWKK